MAEYIDREKIFPNGVFYVSAENPESSLNELINRICNLPTADVVPKSEVEELQAKVARLRKENTELLVSKETDIHISMEKLVKVRTEHPIFKAIEEKVSTEIFEEIDEIMANIEIYVSDRERTNFEIGAYKCHASISLKIAELKKKYTEETE